MFADFLFERQFGMQEKATALGHCPNCGFSYSLYRPNDEEMDRLYSGYRDEEYQKQREKYEPNYTKEFNDSLTNPEDGGKKRRDGILQFIQDYVDIGQTGTVLDFGGDRGQFIPEEFVNADKYVYEISGMEVLEVTDCIRVLLKKIA